MSVSYSKNRATQMHWRVRIVLVFMVLGLSVLVVGLWRIQVKQSDEFRDRFAGQSMRRVRLPAPRGLVFDRHGVCLADNEPSYCVAVYIEELRQRGAWSNTARRVMEVVEDLSGIIGRPVEVDFEEALDHIRKKRLLPFLAWRRLDQPALARLAEYPDPLPGIGVQVEPVRVYPEGKTLSHVLGYVGRADIDPDPNEKFHFYLPSIEGKQGIESRRNRYLAGRSGGRLIRVNASMLKHEVLREKPPVPGNDLRLSIDVRIQRLVEQALARTEISRSAPSETVRGAVVILDPRNGDVLAMASAPAYDPNLFIPRISSAHWRQLISRKIDKPLLNRAVAEHYAPGSVFKPVVALSALAQGASPDTRYPCVAGGFHLGPVTFRCWDRIGHGDLTLPEAIEQSCNPHFCQLGLECGYEPIHHMGELLGLGQRTGVDVDYEVPGVLPNDAWKREVQGYGWFKGDTCNVSIGQGYLAVTPVQMAQVVATIANGGKVYRPRLVLKRSPGDLEREIPWDPRALAVVRGGMHAVVHGDRGTAKRARVDGVQMAAKTGTAEFGSKTRGRKYTWMILFAPFRQPRYALAMVIEDGDSGGRTVAPRVREIMQGIFEMDGTIQPVREEWEG